MQSTTRPDGSMTSSSTTLPCNVGSLRSSSPYRRALSSMLQSDKEPSHLVPLGRGGILGCRNESGGRRSIWIVLESHARTVVPSAVGRGLSKLPSNRSPGDDRESFTGRKWQREREGPDTLRRRVHYFPSVARCQVQNQQNIPESVREVGVCFTRVNESVWLPAGQLKYVCHPQMLPSEARVTSGDG